MMSTMRIAVTGTTGQVVRSLAENGPARGADIITVGRPVLELADPRTVAPAIAGARPDVLVSAAAIIDGERAEAEPEVAHAVNAEGPAALARCARNLGIPIIHLSSDYVFDGTKPTSYQESDPVAPLSVYGHTKAAAELAVAATQPAHVNLRISWIYSPFGHNFVKSMLRLATGHDEIRVVADQIGNPTAAADVAAGILTVARNLVERPDRAEQYGLFHMASATTATWAEFAEAIFSFSAARGGPTARVVPITRAEYASRFRRPANSRLDCSKIAAVHGVMLPPWQASLALCLDRLLEQRT
jgi:dTDP-4-dehydrorhamnose reductase